MNNIENLDQLSNLVELYHQNQDPTAVGISYREGEVKAYYALRSLRQQARVIEKQQNEAERPDAKSLWQKIKKECLQALQETKDLEIAVWLCEALLRTDGFSGLEQGVHLLYLLVRGFWPHFYPLAENGENDSKLFPLSGLNGSKGNGSLLVPLHTTSLNFSGKEPVTLWDYQQRQKQKDEEGFRITMLGWAQAIGAEHLAKVQEQLAATEHHYSALAAFLDEVCGVYEAPPVSDIFNTLSEIQGFAAKLYNLVVPSEGSQDAGEEEANANEMINKQDYNCTSSGTATSRAEALNLLKQGLTYFQQYESTSPIIHLLERALQWGNMNFSDILAELLVDPASLQSVDMILGIKRQLEPHQSRTLSGNYEEAPRYLGEPGFVGSSPGYGYGGEGAYGSEPQYGGMQEGLHPVRVDA